MPSPGYNFLWGVCALMLVIAIILTFKKGRKANRQTVVGADNTTPEVVVISYNEQRPRIHYPNNNNNNPQLQHPPPVFQSDNPPPSYQEYQKDVRIT